MEVLKTFNCIIRLAPRFDNITLEKNFLKIDLKGIVVYDFRKSVIENFVSGTGEGNFYDYFEKNALVRLVRNGEEVFFEIIDSENNEDNADFVLVSHEFMILADEIIVADTEFMNECNLYSVSNSNDETIFTIVSIANLGKLKEYNLFEYNEVMNIND